MSDALTFLAQAFLILTALSIIGYVVRRIAAKLGIKVNDNEL